jgi:hypothetical protein
MPLSPQATDITLTIGGVDRTSLLRRGSVSIEMRLNQRWSASFDLYHEDGTFSDVVGKNVIIEDDGRAFYGKLDDIEEVRAVDNSIGTEMFYRCKCVDLMSRLDQRVCSEWSVHKSVTAGYIVYWALSQFAWSEGITFAPAASPGGYIAAGADVEKFVFNKQTVLEVIEQMCRLSDFVAFIDVNGEFHFEAAGATMTAPFSITATSANFSKISLRRAKSEGGGSSGSGYWNQSWTRTAWAAWEQRQNTFIGDGVTTEWTLYDPASSPIEEMAAAIVVDVKINGESVDFGGEEEGRAYTWFYGESRLLQDGAEAILTAADTLEVWFHDMTQGFIFVQNLTEINARGTIEGNTGQHARIFDDSIETNFQAATDKAQAALDIADSMVDVVTLEANGYGSSPIYPRPGMLVAITLSYPSISGNWWIQEVTAREVAGAGLKYFCKCIKQGSSRRLPNGVDYFRELARKKPGMTVAGGAGDGGPKTSPINYRFLINNATARDRASNSINVAGALIEQASRIRRIQATLTEEITSDLTVRFTVYYQTSPLTDYVIGEFTIPAGTAVDTTVEFFVFDHDVLPDGAVLSPDIVAGDSSQSAYGIASFLIETVGRGNDLPAVAGVGWLSDYDCGTTYDLDDLVQYNGSTYISLQGSNDCNTPGSSPTYWDLLAQKGDPGEGVATGGTAGQILVKQSGTDYDTGWEEDVRVVGITINGGGVAITTGVKGDIQVPFGYTITEWTILCDQSGSIVIDIWKDAYANYPPTVADTITAAAKPTVSGATKGSSSTLTGWTTTITAGDTLRFNVDSASTVTRATLTLKLRRA